MGPEAGIYRTAAASQCETRQTHCEQCYLLTFHILKQEQLGHRIGLLCPIYMDKVFKLKFLSHLRETNLKHRVTSRSCGGLPPFFLF